MSLGSKQELFSSLVPGLINEAISLGYGVRIGEVYRAPEQARLMAERGLGIANSNHTRKLAIDLFLSIDGRVTWNLQDYQKLGDYWKAQHELCRWGGDFRTRDGVHFSLEHNGVA